MLRQILGRFRRVAALEVFCAGEQKPWPGQASSAPMWNRAVDRSAP
jgi:hypothetical protein